MITITEISDLESALKEYFGFKVEIWLFSVSLKRLVFRLSMDNRSEIVYIIAVSCQYIKGPFSWEKSNLQIRRTLNAETSRAIYELYDVNVGFELISFGGVALAIGNESDFTSFFDSFHF